MRVAIGADHAGYEDKQWLAEKLGEAGHEVVDVGTDSDESVDYPIFARKVAERVRDRQAERGVLVCGSGLGMAVAANKVKGVRAVPVDDDYSAEMSRRHNDANVVCLGSRRNEREKLWQLLQRFLGTEFEGGRHQRRVDEIMAIEQGDS